VGTRGFSERLVSYCTRYAYRIVNRCKSGFGPKPWFLLEYYFSFLEVPLLHSVTSCQRASMRPAVAADIDLNVLRNLLAV